MRKNVMLRKPRRQIDIVAESTALALSVDCKHWKSSPGSTELSRLVEAQVQRTRLYKRDARLMERPVPVLPMILTLHNPQVRVVDYTPIVPIILLRDFLSNLSRFDGFAFV